MFGFRGMFGTLSHYSDVAPVNRTVEKLVIPVYNEKEDVDNQEITFSIEMEVCSVF